MNHSWIVERSVLENWTVPWSLMRLSRAGENHELHLRRVESKVLPYLTKATRPAMDQSSLTAKGKPHSRAVAPDSPALWVLRDILGFTGTTFGCGQGLRGARTAAGSSR
jgi:hypothetical protein